MLGSQPELHPIPGRGTYLTYACYKLRILMASHGRQDGMRVLIRPCFLALNAFEQPVKVGWAQHGGQMQEYRIERGRACPYPTPLVCDV